MSRKAIIPILAVALALACGAAHAEGRPSATSVRLDDQHQKEYARIAGRAVSLADACMAIEVISGPIALLDEIETTMISFGATEEEYVEWESNIVSAKSADIQKMLRQQDEWSARSACWSGIAGQRLKLEKILAGAPLPTADQ